MHMKKTQKGKGVSKTLVAYTVKFTYTITSHCIIIFVVENPCNINITIKSVIKTDRYSKGHAYIIINHREHALVSGTDPTWKQDTKRVEKLEDLPKAINQLFGR